MEWNNENSKENINPQLETGRKEKVLIDKNGTISETNNYNDILLANND